MGFSQKAGVTDDIADQRVLCMFEYFGGAEARLVVVIGRNAENTSEYYAIDLGTDPDELMRLSDEDLGALLKSPSRPMRRLKSNAAPLLMASDCARDFALGKSPSADELQRRAQLIIPGSHLSRHLVGAHDAGRREKVASPHVEQLIYDGFTGHEDEALQEQFRSTAWQNRLPIVDQFLDQRPKWLGRCLVYLERPGVLQVGTLTGYSHLPPVHRSML